MYNIASHYQSIFEHLKKVVHHRRLLYLFPYGSTDPQNIETVTDDLARIGGVIDEGPLFIFYDQEPIYDNFNYTLFDYIEQNFQPPFVLVTTERDSLPVQKIIEKYKWPVIDYFHHIFAASDWYRGYRLNEGILPLNERKIRKKFITFNRITGNSRVYRSLFIGELAKRNLLNLGHISYSKECPVHGSFINNMNHAVSQKLITEQYSKEVIKQINKIDRPLRIDNPNATYIENDSMTLGPLEKLMESFVYIVTETCFWEQKKHLTEKIFKPIVAKQPFILLGCANNLEYLKEYGFKTFDAWWDEGYDKIKDPIKRIEAVVTLLENISKMDNSSLEKLLVDMQSVIDHNYKLFFSFEFIDNAWKELQDKLTSVIPEHQRLILPKNRFLIDLYIAQQKIIA